MTRALQQELAASRAAQGQTITLDDCRRVAAAEPKVLLSTPEWTEHLRVALAEVDRLRGLIRLAARERQTELRDVAAEQRWSDRADAEGVERGSY